MKILWTNGVLPTVLSGVIAAALVTNVNAETLDTRIGKLEFTHAFADGYPTDATVDKLFDEMDFQRAVQAYIWSIPLVSMAQWRYAHEQQLGAENGQIVFVESYKDKLGGLTYNATTPYVLPFIDLTDGPWILEMPGPALSSHTGRPSRSWNWSRICPKTKATRRFSRPPTASCSVSA